MGKSRSPGGTTRYLGNTLAHILLGSLWDKREFLEAYIKKMVKHFYQTTVPQVTRPASSWSHGLWALHSFRLNIFLPNKINDVLTYTPSPLLSTKSLVNIMVNSNANDLRVFIYIFDITVAIIYLLFDISVSEQFVWSHQIGHANNASTFQNLSKGIVK